MEEPQDLVAEMTAVLKMNDRGDYTMPNTDIYPHQWLWDSCFIAIGLRHIDIERAQKEVLSLLRGQWSNGMIPHMILSSTDHHITDGRIWRSWVNPHSPDDVATSGITQPPMLAEAVLRVGDKLKNPERRSWYQSVYPAILAYHEWLYKDRDPHNEGLVLQLHPWETGLDNTPPWMSELREHLLPFWIRAVEKLHLEPLVNVFRKDTHHNFASSERMSTVDALTLYHMQRRLRRKLYDTEKIVNHSLLLVEDLSYNSILIRANSCLRKIAKAIGRDLPDELKANMAKTEEALEQLWDAYTGEYYSRNFVTHKLLKVSSVAAFLPLYGGSISKERAEQLVEALKNKKRFWPAHPVPSTPIDAPWFKPHGYWAGPTWININWLIIDGLKRYGYDQLAEELTGKTVALVEQSGAREYFSPLDGSPAGAGNFSWTAALTIDLLKSK